MQREIAYALKREITVIPVLINGVQLPDQELLPDDIKGLLDHQAATVSVAGFRHEMAGLVKDIRSIGPRKPWRLLGAIAATIILSVIGGISVYSLGFNNLLEHLRLLFSSPGVASTTQNGLWKSRPGEWVMYAIDKGPVAYFLKPSSIKAFGDSVAYTARYPSYPAPQSSAQGAYKDETTVLDCKKSVFLMTERTIYNSAGEVIFHFKSSEPESSDLSSGQTIASGSILTLAEFVVCDEKLRTLLLSNSRFNNVHLSYLSNSPRGDGNVLHGPITPTSNPAYAIGALFVEKKNGDHGFAEIFPGQNVIGLPPQGYRTIAQNIQINCAGRKILSPVLEFYDGDDNLVYLGVQTSPQPIDVVRGSIFDLLSNFACGAPAFNVAGTPFTAAK